MKKNIITAVFVCLAFLVLLSGCDDIASGIPYPEEELINSNIRNLSFLDQNEETGTSRFGPVEDSGTTCPLYGYEACLGSYDNVCLSPETENIWPGALIDGPSILTGAYKPINVKRRSLTISIDGGSNVGGRNITVNPVYPGVPEALAQFGKPGLARVIHKMENVYSADQLTMLFPVHLVSEGRSGLPPLEEVFDFAGNATATRKLIQFIFIYYTASIGTVKHPADFFDPSVTWEQIAGEISGSVSPVYVSSVSYGKMGFIFVESAEDNETLTAALNFTIDGAYAAGNEERYKNVIDESTISCLLIGQHKEADFTGLGGFDDVRSMVAGLRDYEDISSYEPLIYRLKYLKNYNFVRVVLSAGYCKRECEDLPYKLTIRSVLDGGVPLIKECEVRSDSEIILSTVPVYHLLDGEHRFIYWKEPMGLAEIENYENNNTIARSFRDNCTIDAQYYFQGGPTPSPTSDPGSTSSATSPPVTNPPVTNPPVTNPPVTNPPVTNPPVTNPPVTNPPVTNPPVTNPPGGYSLTVTYYDSSGESHTYTEQNISPGSCVSISTVAAFDSHAVHVVFKNWSLSGNAYLLDSSPDTQVCGIQSNASVSAEY
ncbi:MAG: thiol-activated cytolysin family protein [Spirochaetales bacterium]|nr:thiol-activated cytolysin family protein [Spirochaetales bacterium]